jgi:hypothetical protein
MSMDLCKITKMSYVVAHVHYARSKNGVSWWYFDATEVVSVYIEAIGIDPYTATIGASLM